MLKAIPGREGAYEASTDGEIRSVDRVVPSRARSRGRKGFQHWKGKTLSSSIAKNEYRVVVLSRGSGRGVCSYVHRLVALTFMGPCPDGLEVCHNNGVRVDCNVENLRYDTRSANSRDRIIHGTVNVLRGEDSPIARLDERKVRWIS